MSNERVRLGGTRGPLLLECDLLVLDLDGVVYVGPQAVPGAVQALAAVRQQGISCCYATNNASRPPAEVAEHLTSLGVPAAPEDVVTSSQAAARIVADRFGPGVEVLCVGGPGVAQACREAGLVPVLSALDPPAAVIQGYGRDVGWADLAEAAYAVRGGALWVATNTDATLPTERGPAPGNGALVAAVRNAVDVDPVVAGKPQPGLFVTAAEAAGAHAPLVVGDRLDTDIAGAVAAEQASVLVLTGVHGPGELLQAPAHQRPAYVTCTLSGLHASHPPTEAENGWWRCRSAAATVRDGVLTIDGASSVQAPADGDPADEDAALDALRAACAAMWTAGTEPGSEAIDAVVPDRLLTWWETLRRG